MYFYVLYFSFLSLVIVTKKLSLLENRDGKLFEKVCALIMDSFNDPDSIVSKNLHLQNKVKRKREFDIVIRTKSHGIPFTIGIECKNHKSDIPVGVIEQFKGKCDRFPDINKKVIIASGGFQADSTNAAKEFGIELYTLADISVETNKKLMNISKFKYLNPTIEWGEFSLDIESPTDNALIMPIINSDLIVYYSDRPFFQNVISCITNALRGHSNHIKATIYEQSVYASIGKAPPLQVFKLEKVFENIYILGTGKQKIRVTKIRFSIVVQFLEHNMDFSMSKSYTNIIDKSAVSSNILTAEQSTIGKFDLIKNSSDTMFSAFFTPIGGTANKLDILIQYDPLTGRVTKEF